MATKTPNKSGSKTNSKSTASKSNGTTAAKTAENGTREGGVSLQVKKTYKLYIGGQFPRTESGRYYELNNKKGELIANVCLGTRKDFRNSVVAARNAFGSWSGRSHYNRSQIIYRIAEIMEGRRAQFVEELVMQGSTQAAAAKEVQATIDRVVYYAGWADKYQQVFSAVNPVASSHFNFSMLEPTGVVSVMAPEENGLLGLVSVVLPVIIGGNTAVVLASNSKPLSSITWSEVLHSSDVPGGVVNMITGDRAELIDHFSTHMDVNAIVFCGPAGEDLKKVQLNATHNVKRVIHRDIKDWYDGSAQSPYFISDNQETKTTWHPIGI